MAFTKSLSILIIGFLVCGLMFISFPTTTLAQVQVMGCCQFEGDEGGCWFPADPDACANMNGEYFEDARCNTEITKCVENKKDDSGSTESEK